MTVTSGDTEVGRLKKEGRKMSRTKAQELQRILGDTELKAVLFAVSIEAARYNEIPVDRMPIEISTLIRGSMRLADVVAGNGSEDFPLLLHEWETFLPAIVLEVRRYETLLEEDRPKYIKDLEKALHVVRGSIMLDRMSIKDLVKK
jgi:hypothetical protein